jgi:uncharacterized protein YbaR (Trm112 family)
MNCPVCKQPMERVRKHDKRVITWKCRNPRCKQFMPIKETAR